MPRSYTTKEFAQAYKALNKEQKRAVDTIEGPVMVVAGPGTGKTQTLATRIANILLQTDIEPDNILALTFTESGARAMRERLVGLIGTPAYYVTIGTFHSFCSSVIKDNPDFFTLDPSSEPLSDLERLQLVERTVRDLRLGTLRPVGAPHHYTKAIMGAISDLKREGIDTKEFAALLDKEDKFLHASEGELTKTVFGHRSRALAKNQELLRVYREYQKNLASTNRYDFDDMVSSVVDAFRTKQDLLLDYQERFHYLLVDEYQDTNSAQNELVLLLAKHWGAKANLFVVGDPDQCVYRFSGASIENQLFFIKVYPRATVITMRANYRSTQVILDAADSLIAHNNLRISDVAPGVDPHLQSVSGQGSSLRLAKLSTSTAELVFLAEDIKKRLGEGVKAEDIAIIYRKNAESSRLADVLVRYGVDYSVAGGANVLEDPTVQRFVRILRVVDEMHRRQEDEDLFTILHYDVFHIDPLDVLRLARLAGDLRKTLFDVLASSDLLDSLVLTSRGKLEQALATLAHFSELSANLTFTEFFETVLNDSGYLGWVLAQSDSHHRVSRLNTLFDEVKQMNKNDHRLTLALFLANLDLMQAHNLRLEESSYGKDSHAVTLTTAHRAKGLEWDHVYILRAADRHWGNNVVREKITLPEGILTNTNLSDKEKNEDERRLFYVALTRGRQSVTLTHSREYSDSGVVRAAIPSMFLGELGDAPLDQLDTTKVEEDSHRHLERLLSSPDTVSVSAKEEEYLRELVDQFSLSPTALNSYLECPYKFKLDKLLKVPHSKKPHLAFGTAVHTALEQFYHEYKDRSVLPSKAYLISQFQEALRKEVLTPEEEQTRLEEGRKILSAYYDFFRDDFREPLFLEKFFRVQLNDITLTGKIDRIETLDPAARTIRVIDYKTGKGKTLGQIEGTTKDSDGNLKRQLVFYRLLIELDRRLHNISFGEAELDFVTVPSDKNKSGRHRLTITSRDIAELKRVIQKVMSDIRALHFPRTTDLQICAKCYFAPHCYPEGLPAHSPQATSNKP